RQQQLLVVAGGGLVSALDFHDDEKETLPLEIGVGVAKGAEQLDPPHFEILQVPAVMQVTHGVHLGIPHADDNRVLREHRILSRYTLVNLKNLPRPVDY